MPLRNSKKELQNYITALVGIDNLYDVVRLETQTQTMELGALLLLKLTHDIIDLGYQIWKAFEFERNVGVR